MLTSLAALGIFILVALAKQSVVGWIGLLLAITLSLAAYVTWIRYRRLWFALPRARRGRHLRSAFTGNSRRAEPFGSSVRPRPLQHMARIEARLVVDAAMGNTGQAPGRSAS